SIPPRNDASDRRGTGYSGCRPGVYRWCARAPSPYPSRERVVRTISEVAVENGLPALGWTVDLEVAFVALERAGLRAGRVAIDFGAALRVLTAGGEEQVGLAPDLCRQGRSGERPGGGDWVGLEGEPGAAVVVERLPRRATFTRRRAGSEGAAREQVIAANVDVA